VAIVSLHLRQKRPKELLVCCCTHWHKSKSGMLVTIMIDFGKDMMNFEGMPQRNRRNKHQGE
jgi:hypothetical protein